MTQQWWSLSRGDLDTTIAQVGFNLAQMVIPVFLLIPVGISAGFSVTHLLPGYAFGFLIGSLGLVFLAARLARREGTNATSPRTSMATTCPPSLPTRSPSCCRCISKRHDANRAWEIGAAAVVWTGIIKLAAAPFAGIFRRFIPAPAAMTVFGAAMYSYLALVLLQRVFDQPLVGLIALGIIFTAVLANIPITRWRIPPFMAAWIVPLSVALVIGYVHPKWSGLSLQMPFAATPEPWRAMTLALPYLSVIAPIAIYQVLQDIASVAGAAAAGDDYDVRAILACDGLGTLVCGLAGSVITPVIYAMHPPYKAVGARISFAFWTPVLFLAVVDERAHDFCRAIVSLADSRGHHRLRFYRRRHGDVAARRSEIPGRGAARLRASGRRGGCNRRKLGAARAQDSRQRMLPSKPRSTVPSIGPRSWD